MASRRAQASGRCDETCVTVATTRSPGQRRRDVNARAAVRGEARALVVEIVAGERERVAVARRGGRRQRLAASAPMAAASKGSETS